MPAHRYRLPLAVALGVAAVGIATFVLRPRGGVIEAVAVEPTAYFSAEQLERAEDYNGPQRLIGLAGIAVSGVTLAALALRPPAAFRRRSIRLAGHPLAGGAAVGASIAVLLAVVTLPLGIVSHERAVDVGLSTQSFLPWLSDVGKSTAIGAAIAGAGGLVAVTLVRRFPRHWWAPAGVVVAAAAVLFTYVAPVVLDPVFNRFEPLPEGELRGSVLDLAERAEVDVGEVYRVDASRRTTASNAYVGGLGETKRVVLYDNLIEGFPPDQVRSVVAHELAHVKHRDVPKGLLWVAIVALPSMLVVQRLTEWIDHRAAERDRGAAGLMASASRGDGPVRGNGPVRGDGPARGAPAVVPAIALSIAVVSFLVGLAGNWLSREVEARADAFALELTEEPDAFIGLQRSLAVENVSQPDPPEVLHELFGTHPTTVERIGFGRAWESGR